MKWTEMGLQYTWGLSPLQASPLMLCPHGRTQDLDALLAVIGGARVFIYAEVMEFFPTTRFSHPTRWEPGSCPRAVPAASPPASALVPRTLTPSPLQVLASAGHSAAASS